MEEQGGGSLPRDATAPATPRAAGRRVEGERRVITVLFCDVAGSTAMAEQLDPEEWAEIMNDAFAYLTGPVQRYEGTVARLMGDAILAFFGAPVAHEDDPQRAVMAALEIMDGIRPFREQVNREYGLDFALRIGINTGPVMVGDVGSSSSAGEYTAMGDAVNLAARMEQTAQPGTIQIAENTQRLVAPLFDLDPLEPIEVKGKAEPVQAFRVIGHKAAPGRLRGIEGLSAPLVGRTREMEALQGVLSEVQRGRGQIVCLIGEAGLGKSRLIEEARAWWLREVGDQAPWLESRGASYNTARPYSLFEERIREMFGVEEGDSSTAIREKVAAGLEVMGPEQLDLCTAAIEMVLAAREDSDRPELPPEALKRDLFHNVSQAWREAAAQSPLVMVFDDLHWADHASMELLLHLFRLTDEIPLLVLCAFRPYRQAPSWQAKQTAEAEFPHRYTEVAIGPLSEEESDTLVGSLLTISDLPVELRRLILQKTDGNPFFVEEVVRTLIDSGAVVRDGQGMHWRAAVRVEDIAIPDNLQALLTARIDRLEEESRHVLQLAAVIGRSFYHRVLGAISDEAMSLERQLGVLQRVELIREATRHPEMEYTFLHELARDAAYSSILRRRRREFHQQVGEAIESLFEGRLEEQAHRLAYHFSEGRDPERALRYATMAGDAAARLYANAEAVTHYGQALELAVAGDVPNDHLVHLSIRLGRTLEVSGRPEEALATYERLAALGRERDDRTLELAALIPQATLRSTFTPLFDPDAGRALSTQTLDLARSVGDPQAEAKALWNLMLVGLYSGGNRQEAVELGERAAEIARLHGLREELAYALNDVARAYFESGRRADGWRALEEAQGLWRELGNLPMLGDSLGAAAQASYEEGEFNRAISFTDEGVQVSRSIRNLWGEAMSLFIQGPIAIEQGDFAMGLQTIERSLALSLEANFRGPEIVLHALLYRVYLGLGDPASAGERAEAALAGSASFPGSGGFRLGLTAHLHVQRGEWERARAVAQEAYGDLERAEPMKPSVYMGPFTPFVSLIDGEVTLGLGAFTLAAKTADFLLASLGATGQRHLLSEALGLKARALLGLDRPDEARALFREAIAEARAIGSRLGQMAPLAALVDLETQAGNPGEAASLRAQAREVVEYVANHLGTDDLREAFLATPVGRLALGV